MRFKIFISSVQAEFAEARRELKSFLLNDPLLREFVSNVFVFEDEPAATQNPAGVYLDQIERSDIYIGIFGAQYGCNMPGGEVSPTEKEYDAASVRGIPQWVYFFDRGDEIDPRMAVLRSRVDAEHKRRRVGSSVELVKQVYATFVQYLRERHILTNEPFDAAVVDEATMEDVDLPRVKWFFEKAVEERGFPQIVGSSPERILKHLAVMRECDGKLTRAALMLFGKRPKKWCSSGMIKCICCAGIDYRRPFVMQVYEGDLFDQVDQAEIFVLTHVNRVVGTRETRTDAPISYDVPQRAIKEAIVNAVAHRDYYSNGSVEVRVFADRVEILNPGELPPGKDVAWLMGEHVSIPANPLIAEAFYQTRYIDRAGSGIDDMMDACRSDGLPLPEIKVEYQSFVTVIRRQIAQAGTQNGNGITATITAKVAESGRKASDRKDRTDKILSLMRENESITLTAILSAIGGGKRTVEREVAALKKSGRLMRIGGRKQKKWVVCN